MRALTRTQRLLAVILLVWYLPSCATAGWQTQTVVPQETKRTVYAGDVRVTTIDGTTHAFRGAWVSADSLGGWLVEPTGVERAFALTEVEAVQVRRARGPSQPAGSGASSRSAHRGGAVLFEAAVGSRLGQRPYAGINDDRWVASWDLGFMASWGASGVGATLLAAVDDAGSRWGIRPRFRRWLGPKTALDFGAGVLLGGGSNNVEQRYPGFTALVALSHGQLGASLELQSVRTERGTDQALYLAFRANGGGAGLLTAVESFILLVVACSLSNWQLAR